MSTHIFVLCAIFEITVVTANPLLQAFLPQACPICEQNSLKSQIKNLLLQNIQPYLNPDPQIFFGQNPTSIQAQPAFPIEPNCLCPPPNVQNQLCQLPYEQGLSQPCHPYPQQPQNIPPIPESVNKIFTNTNLRSILDPNTKLFDQNGAEVPRNGPCSSSPNVVNNYIIIPPEFLLEDKTCIPKDDKKMPEAKMVKNNVVVPKSDKKDENSVSSNDNNRKREHYSNNEQRRQRKRHRNKNLDVKIEVVNEKIQQSTSQVEAPQSIEELKRNHEKVINKKSNNVTDSTKSTEPKRNSPAKIISLHQTRNASGKTNQNNRPFNDSKNIGKSKPRSYTPIEKSVIDDFRRKFPNIPEEIVINLLHHMKLQMQNQNVGVPPFYYSQYPFPFSYNQLISNQFANKPSTQNKKGTSRPPKTNNANGSGKKRKNRRNKIERTKPVQTSTPETCTTSNSFTELNSISAETTTMKNERETTIVSTTTSITTEIPPEVIEVTKPVSTSVTPDITEDTTIETTTKVITELKIAKNNDKEDKPEIEVLELGKEDKLPTILLNELDEYYPDFTGDRLYFSDEDFAFDIIDEDRYHYTTDKNFQLETLNRERRLDPNSKQSFKQPENRYILRLNRDKLRSLARQRDRKSNQDMKFFPRNSQRSRSNFATENPKVIVTLRNENTKPQEDKKPVYLHEEEKIQFKTPPKLEKIDFQTKQINKKLDDIKSSSYSEAKTPRYDSKYKKENKKPKPIRKDHVETVYARSKVATYGTSPIYFSDEITAEQDGWTENYNDEYS